MADISSDCYKTFWGGNLENLELPPLLKQHEWAILNAIDNFGA